MRWRALLVRVAAALAITLCLALIGLPVLALLLRVPAGTLLARLADPLVLSAVRLSLVTSVAAAALIVVLGTPVAWLLATREFRGKRVLEAVIDLPMVLPPTAAGVGLLLAFGRADYLAG